MPTGLPKASLSAFEATYEKGPILGRGASGVAFIVRPKGGPEVQQVAKEICVGRFDEKRRKDAFEESKLLRTLNHDNIVKCLDTFLDDEVLYIVMEYANGGDLGRCIQARRKETSLYPEQTVMGVFVQTCAALLHIHSRRILHRDLKPANVFIVGEGDLSTCTVKLGDFGIAKMLEGTTCQAHSTVGTPSYLSPEICKNNPYGTKSDIWSLGVVLYELVCLKVPFQAGNLPAMALMICTNEPKPLPDSFSEPLENLMRTLLQKDPAKRPPVGDVLHLSYVQRFLSEALVHSIGNDCAAQAKPKNLAATAQSRGESLPHRPGRAADSERRLPSCGPSTTRQRPERFLLQEDASQWCWRRSNSMSENNSGAEKSGATPRAGAAPSRRSDRGERSQRGERGERADRGGDRANVASAANEKLDRGERGDRGDRGSAGSRVPQPDRTGTGANEGTGSTEFGGATGSRMPPADRTERMERSERADMGERADRAERGDRDRTDRSDKAEAGYRPDRPERATRGTDRSERAERLDRGDRVDRSDRADRADRVERQDRIDRNKDRDRGDRDRGDLNRVDRADRDRGDRGDRGNRERTRVERLEQSNHGYRIEAPASRGCHGECNGNCEACERVERCLWLEKAALGSRGGTPDEGIQESITATVESAIAHTPQTVQSEQSPLADTTDEEFNGTPGPSMGLTDTSPAPEVLPPPAPSERRLQEPAPPGAGPPPGTGLFVCNSEFQPRVRGTKKLRRGRGGPGRPPLLIGQDTSSLNDTEARSPTRTTVNKRCFEEESPDKRAVLMASTAPLSSSATSGAAAAIHNSTAPLPLNTRSASPSRALGELSIPNVPSRSMNSTGLRTSDSSPALPPLPPLLAPSRGPVVRSRSVASLHEAKKESLQRGVPHMFRTAPLAGSGSGDRDGNVNKGQGPPPPSLAPPPQSQRQLQPPPPPQRQAPKDDQLQKLAPYREQQKLPTAVSTADSRKPVKPEVSGPSDSRHRREAAPASIEVSGPSDSRHRREGALASTVRSGEAAPACESWDAGDARLSSARLQPVV